MKLRPVYSVSVAALLLLGGTISSRAGQVPTRSPADGRSSHMAAPAAKLAAASRTTTRIALFTAVPRRSPVRHVLRETPARFVRDEPRADRQRSADAGNDRVKPVGPCHFGTAAWYGGHYVGQRTSNGERLDAIHPTAAHRTLPLNSLVRVTNLHNGRSVIVRITDRGPVSERLAIDVSPKAAEELAMKDAGVVPVSIEQVVEVPQASR